MNYILTAVSVQNWQPTWLKLVNMVEAGQHGWSWSTWLKLVNMVEAESMNGFGLEIQMKRLCFEAVKRG